MKRGIPQLSRDRVGVFPYILSLIILTVCALLWDGKLASAYDLALIEPVTLSRDLSAWGILDARPKSQWLAGHIPGARSFCWEDYTRTDNKGIPYRTWRPEDMAGALGEMGLTEKSPVVVYGGADKSWGGEGWSCWVLTWLGHVGPIRLLSGGIQAWSNHGYPLATGDRQETASPVNYKIHLRPEVYITTQEVEGQKSDLVLIDTRSTFEWLKGHLPEAVHINWKDLYTDDVRRPIAPDQMRKLLSRHKIGNKKTVVYYCTGGIRSGYAWLVHALSGLPTARNYEGGMEAWKHRSGQ